MHILTVHDVSSSMKNRHYNHLFLILELTTTMVTAENHNDDENYRCHNNSES